VRVVAAAVVVVIAVAAAVVVRVVAAAAAVVAVVIVAPVSGNCAGRPKIDLVTVVLDSNGVIWICGICWFESKQRSCCCFDGVKQRHITLGIIVVLYCPFFIFFTDLGLFLLLASVFDSYWHGKVF